MTVLVTGASGHIGANLVRALVGAGRKVRCLVHVNRETLSGLDVEISDGDILAPASLDTAMEGVDVVYNLAACISLSMNHGGPVWRINVDGTRNVVEACLRNRVRRLVHFGSIHAFIQEPYDVPVDENRPLATGKKFPVYDRSKAAGVMEVRKGMEQGLDAVIVYPTGVFGPYDYEPSFFGQALINMACHTLPALTTGGFDWVDARDVAAGAMSAEQKAAPGSEYLLSGHWVSVPDIAAACGEVTGNYKACRTVPLWLAGAGAPIFEVWGKLRKTRPLYTRVSLTALKSNRNISREKAARDLGYQPRPFCETMADTLAWFDLNGMLRYDVKSEVVADRE